ncbi:PTS sugar transporter subunit IIB [Clostridioides difficile]|uniref:PTS sugar transporter subunit IIB n=1 Tax=Clostridioides difficile TaxID=1496 RepID=UPI000D1E65D0|nr:PTS sugar transporter subunit IIB [Clostridioides difficile]MDL5065782.1 PTS sugar transporter subunit IIB [Clostridioides difficile]MDN9452357.1 PTS sugar transporter subunit IIB [Clostridioides difficile]MDV9720016.1 PTS sugar transporter subunit IIB [Clostridioides difficile]UUV13544.1 PTS sugar transporter subunit IIB [Clostridioides difficile]VHY37290.1 PTS system lactose/cellobiose-family transporter subunit IIB [Clostridioides difficile]
MIRILLVCVGGMSSTLLVNKMEKDAKKRNIDCKIWAVGEGDIKSELDNFDILLLGPQLRFMLDDVKSIVGDKAPVAIIDMVNYGTCNGHAVLNSVLEILK